MKTTLSTIASTALSAAIVASSAIASASASELDAAAVWNPAPEPEDPPFQCTAQPETMIKSVPGGEMMCLTRGEGICRDNEGVLGVWGFGLDKDTGAISVVDPDGAVMPMYGNTNWAGADKLCIQNIPKKALYKPWHKKNRNLRGEEQEQERELASEDEEMTEPYMAIYGGGKRMAELICHGVGNQGVATQLKMTDLRGYNLAKEGFPFTVTKVKRGQLDDNEDNALWGVQIEHPYEVLSLQKVKPVLKAKIVYDDTYCMWVDNTQTAAPTAAPTTTPISSAPTPVPRGHGETCSKFKKCAPYKDDGKKCKDKETGMEVDCPENAADALYCDYYADEPGAEGEDEKNSKNKNSKDTAPEIGSDAAYYSPFNLFGKCEVCIASSTDIMAAIPCKGQDGECCDNADYGESMCGELMHGGPKVCRPKCSITSEVCYSNDYCCDKMCHIDTSKGPGKQGIGFCMPQH